MRILIDSLVAVMLAGVLAAVILHERQTDDQSVLIEGTRESLTDIRNAITIQIALEEVDLNAAGFPRTIEPSWFDSGTPENHLLTDERPWLEVAGPRERDLEHPRTPIADDAGTLAKFWYNPYRGIVRARVPGGLTDRALLEAYNATNGCHLSELILGAGTREELAESQ